MVIYYIFNKNGTAFPGKVALTIDKSFLEIINEKCEKIILITGTNGKTTSNNIMYNVLKDYVCLSNLKGANMIQGVATTYVRNTQSLYDFGVFEVDEGSLDRITSFLKPDYILISNFFRDQLDRYGEIEGIINEVLEDIKLLPETKLILNADDPYVFQFTNKLTNDYISFGLDVPAKKISETNLLVSNCPICGDELHYIKNTYGHLGNYTCYSCGFNNFEKDYTVNSIEETELLQKIRISHNNEEKIIQYPFNGLYNSYNVCGVYALSNELGIDKNNTINTIENFSFSMGRMEIFDYKNKKVEVILTKNPIGLSQATRIISNDKRTKIIVHILNDNQADGRDISWIWDANTLCANEDTIKKYYCSGLRAEEIALKKKYDEIQLEKIHIINNKFKAIDTALEEEVEIVYILPTYTAVFKTRDYVQNKVQEIKR